MRRTGQGTIESSQATTAGTLLAQGATEYLVLLAVVLVIALVGIALLGFFPGTVSDAQARESEIYWESATPIAITESSARIVDVDVQVPYFRIRNTGSYPLRIMKVLGAGSSANLVYMAGIGADRNISDYFYMAPGEEKIFVSNHFGFAAAEVRQLQFYVGGTPVDGGHSLRGLSSGCTRTPPYGIVWVKNFGFEYVQYVEDQQITKRQIGKDLLIRCRENYN